MSLNRLLCLPVALTALGAALTGCATSDDNDRPQVVASFYPLQFVAERIVGNHADVTNLTKPGTEPHDLELPPRQTAALSGADVVLHEDGLQPALDQALRNDPPERVVDAAKVVDLYAEDNGDDPHFWLDPTLLAAVAESFTDAIVEADPTHADDYRTAEKALVKDLSTLDSELRAGLATCTTRTLVVSHDAFGYLARRYDLQVRPIAGLSPGAEPSLRSLSELSDLIRAENLTTVFTERLASPKLAETLASDLDLKTGVLDPIEGLVATDASKDYLSLMRENLAAIQKAGGCR